MTHTPVRLRDPDGWIMYVSNEPRASRLVIFVHGFNGKAVSSWNEFAKGGSVRSSWWAESDMLFVGYKSTRDSITGVSYRLRSKLSRFYPKPATEVMNLGGFIARKDTSSDYDELYIVGHSLGGLVVRRAMADSVQDWLDSGRTQARPAALDAKLRLFSPATAGFRAAGVLGLFKASGYWRATDAWLSRSSAYTDMDPKSETLKNTRMLTEKLAALPGMESLKASILWANRDNFVLAERYATDHVDHSVDGQDHGSVCQPSARKGYLTPWEFVETGRYT